MKTIEPISENYLAINEHEDYYQQELPVKFNHWMSRLNKCTQPISIKNNRIQKVLEYIQLHYQDTIVLTEVADQVGMTSTALSKLISRFFYITFTDLIMRVRVAHAVEMIRTTDLPLGIVGYSCGFSTQRTFIRSFRQTTGMVPSEFRKVCNYIEEEAVLKVF